MEVLAAIRIGGCHREPKCLADEAGDEHRLGTCGAVIEDAKLRFCGEAFFNEIDKLNGLCPLPAYCRRGRIRIIRDALAAVPDGRVDVVASMCCLTNWRTSPTMLVVGSVRKNSRISSVNSVLGAPSTADSLESK